MIHAPTSSTRLLLVLAATGAVSFVLVWAIDGATRADYHASRHPVSALSLGERGWVQIANFVITGAAVGAFALGVRRTFVDGRAAVWVPALLTGCGLALVASGVFVMDPPVGYPPGSSAGVSTWHGVAHGLAGLVVFSTLPAAAFVSAGRFWAADSTRWLGVVSIVAGFVTIAAFVVFALFDDSGRAGAGLWQRTSIVAGWGWIAVTAITLLVTAPEPRR